MAKVQIGQIKVNNNFLPTGLAFIPIETAELDPLRALGYNDCINISRNGPFFIKNAAEGIIFDALAIGINYRDADLPDEGITSISRPVIRGREELDPLEALCTPGEWNIVKATAFISRYDSSSSKLYVRFIINGNYVDIYCGTVDLQSERIRVENITAIVGIATYFETPQVYMCSTAFQKVLVNDYALHAEHSSYADIATKAGYATEAGYCNTANTAGEAGRANTAGHADTADTADTALSIKAEACIQDPETALPMIANGGIYCVNARVRRNETDDFYNVNFLVSVPNKWDGSYLASTVSMIRVGDAPKAISRVFLELKNGTIDRCMYVNETFDSVNIADRCIIESCRRIEMVY